MELAPRLDTYDKRIGEANNMIHRICKEMGAYFEQWCQSTIVRNNGTRCRNMFARDGIHLSKEGARVMANAMSKVIPGNSRSTGMLSFT